MGSGSLRDIDAKGVSSKEGEREKHARRDFSEKIRVGGCEVVRGKKVAI